MRGALPVRARTAPLAAVAATLALALAPAAALATPGQAVIYRCLHNQPLGGFSQAAYAQALSELSADAEEYSGCAEQIQQAQLASASGLGGGSGVPVPLVATPAEQREIAQAAKAGSAPVRLGGQTIRPGVVHATVTSAISTLPGPLLAVLALTLAFLLTMAALAIRHRVRPGSPD